jgi:hypothetical protein
MPNKNDNISKHCIINFANSARNYSDGQKRLEKSLKKHALEIDFLKWTNEKELGCPPHKDVPYAFKPYAFKKAREFGYNVILWLDASIYAIKPLKPVFDYIEWNGCYFEKALPKFWTGEWSSDIALRNLNVSRTGAMGIKELAATVMGLNFRSEIANRFFDKWFGYAQDGETFVGEWTNERLQVSSDPRVKGHRHDQTVASILAHQMNIKLLEHHTFFGPRPDGEICLICQRTYC